MTRIAIIQAAGHPVYDMVLKGVYGTVEPGQTDDQVVFSAAPEFAGVSHLFRQMPKFAVRQTGIQIREVADHDAALAKAQLLFGLGSRWAEMYSPHTQVEQGAAPSVGSALLSGERDAVAEGVRGYLSSLGMQLYAVPVLVRGEVPVHGQYLGGAADMVRHMSGRAISADPAGQARALGTAGLTGTKAAIEAAASAAAAPQEPPAAAAETAAPAPQAGIGMASFMGRILGRPFGFGAAPDDEDDADEGTAPAAQAQAPEAGQAAEQALAATQAPAWKQYCGVDATVRATLYVVAPDAASVPRALHLMLDAHQDNLARLHMDVQDVAECRDLARPELAPDYHDEDRDDFDQDRY